jgi:hypothetical protein
MMNPIKYKDAMSALKYLLLPIALEIVILDIRTSFSKQDSITFNEAKIGFEGSRGTRAVLEPPRH